MTTSANYHSVGTPLTPTIRSFVGVKIKDHDVITLGPLLGVNYATNGTGKRMLRCLHCDIHGVFAEQQDTLLRGFGSKTLSELFEVVLLPKLNMVSIVRCKQINYIRQGAKQFYTFENGDKLVSNLKQRSEWSSTIATITAEGRGVIHLN